MQLCVVVIISFIILHMILIDNSSTQKVLSYSIKNCQAQVQVQVR